MSGTAIRVLVVDDHAVVREGIRHVLSRDHGFDVVAEADDGIEAMALAKQHAPDVVVLDVTMPRESGLAVAASLRRTVPETRVLMLTMHDRGEDVLEAVRAGAHGYVLKDAGPAELRDAVRAVNAGQEFFSPRVAGRLSAALRGELVREQRDALPEDGPTRRSVPNSVSALGRSKATGRAS
jgi:DNA-binding NarL/FixJ family response regulator